MLQAVQNKNMRKRRMMKIPELKIKPYPSYGAKIDIRLKGAINNDTLRI